MKNRTLLIVGILVVVVAIFVNSLGGSSGDNSSTGDVPFYGGGYSDGGGGDVPFYGGGGGNFSPTTVIVPGHGHRHHHPRHHHPRHHHAHFVNPCPAGQHLGPHGCAKKTIFVGGHGHGGGGHGGGGHGGKFPNWGFGGHGHGQAPHPIHHAHLVALHKSSEGGNLHP